MESPFLRSKKSILFAYLIMVLKLVLESFKYNSEPFYHESSILTLWTCGGFTAIFCVCIWETYKNKNIFMQNIAFNVFVNAKD